MERKSFESVLLTSHNEPVAALLADKWRGHYPLVFDVFQRANQLEAEAFRPWHTLTLLARAERELFLNTDWLLYSKHGRSTINGTRAPGLEAVYRSAAETIALLLRSYLDAFETDGLPLYRMVNDGVLVEVTEFDQIGNINLSTLLRSARSWSYPHEIAWATLLYHRRTDVYWHSLIAGDVWSGEKEARDPVQMYDRQPENHTTELRQKMIADQQAGRKAALQAIVRGQIQPPAVGLSAEEYSPASVQHRIEAKHDWTFSEVLAAFGATEELSKYRRRFPYLVDLFSRVSEMDKLSTEQWDALSLREVAERELFLSKRASGAPWLGATLDAYAEKVVESARIFYAASQVVARHINSFIHDYGRGLPLYEKVNGELRRLDPAHGLGSFVTHLAEEDLPANYRNDPPQWASRIYVKRTEVEAFELFFGGDFFDTEDSVMARKRALELLLTGRLFESEQRTELLVGARKDADDGDTEALRQRVADLERQLADARARAIDPDHAFYPPKLDQANQVWRAAVVAKEADANSDRKTISGIATGDWMADWLKKCCQLSPAQAEKIVEIASFAGRGRPGRVD